jgi:hypothetical protein
VNVIPLDATYSAFNFSPLNIAVSAGDMPVLDPELRKRAVRLCASMQRFVPMQAWLTRARRRRSAARRCCTWAP